MSPPDFAEPVQNRINGEERDQPFPELCREKLLGHWSDTGSSLSIEEDAVNARKQDLGSLIAMNHRLNAALWEEEDLARRPLAPDSEIAKNKRRIDWLNQHRSRSVEVIDELIELRLRAVVPNKNARCNSETPGAIIDRLSIASLKVFYMRRESLRSDSTGVQRRKSAEALFVLEAQHSDLCACLVSLVRELASGKARFRSYRHFKMYNDPDLNPHLRSGKPRSEP